MSGEGALPNRPDRAASSESTAMPTVAGRRESSGWAVFIKDGDRVIVLETIRARQFAADIVDVCDVIDGCHASVQVQAGELTVTGTLVDLDAVPTAEGSAE